jgi:hypothetical protein
LSYFPQNTTGAKQQVHQYISQRSKKRRGEGKETNYKSLAI